MGTVTLPKLSQTGTNEWADVEDNDKALRDEINGNIENINIDAAAAIAHSKLANITAGRVLMGNASNVPTATALSGDVTVNSSGVTALAADTVGATELVPLPVCILAKTDNLAHNTAAVEAWATESTDTDGMHSTSSNTSRITIQTAGIYRVTTSLYIPGGGGLDNGDDIYLELLVGGISADGTSLTVTSGLVPNRIEASAVYSLAASTYLETLYYQNSGATIAPTKRFSATYICPAS